MSTSQNFLVRFWKWWFTPRSTDTILVYRERALRTILPIIILLRILGTIQNYSGAPDLPEPYAPLWVYLAFFIVPVLFSFYFLARHEVNWAGTCFLLHWYLVDMLSLPTEGYWYPGFQISLIIQIVLGTLFLPSRAILPFMLFQLTTVGSWGNWLDVNYYDPPLLSSGQPVAIFQRALFILAAQETIIMFIVRYLRLQIEKSIHLQQDSINLLQTEITEHHLAEAALRESELRFRTLLENIPAITYIVGVGGEPLNPTLYISPQIAKLSNHTSAEFLNDPLLWSRLVHPDDQARVMALSERGDQTGESLVTDYRINGKEHKTCWIHDENVLVKDDRGQPLYRVGVWTDITERKQAELALQRSEDLYRRVIDAAGAVPYVYDPAARTLRFLGDGILPMTGYPASELMSIDQWKNVEQEGFPRGKLAHLTYEEADRLTDEDNSIPWECDFRIRTRDGQTRWIADTSVKGFDETGEHIVAVGLKQDITERKRVEEEIKQLNLELEQRVCARTAELEAANKEMEAFSYSVSHDLRAPLRGVNSFAKIIKNDFSTGMDPIGLGFLDKVIASGMRMNNLIDDLLSFSRTSRKELHKQEVDLNPITHTLIETFAPEIGSRQIEWVLADLPSAQADPTLIQQVFANLIGNAVKYTGKREVARIEVGCVSKDGETIYFVRDNGAGFDMQFSDRLFGVFQRLHREDEFEGIGIGLATVQRIIQRHGGRIWAEAEVDKGATFYFTLG